MAKPLSLLLLRPKCMTSSLAFTTLTTPPLAKTPKFSLLTLSTCKPLNKLIFSVSPFSTAATPYPLQYDLLLHRPDRSSIALNRRRLGSSDSDSSPEPDPTGEPPSELSLDAWVDRKLSKDADLDKSKRKYYNKRRKRLYGMDSDEDSKKEDSFVELKPEVVEFDRLHKREEELYFYDTFAYPWEKDKHYKMVYRLEKKYFPDQCLDKAFLDPGETIVKENVRGKNKKRMGGERSGGVKDRCADDKGLVFFEGEKSETVDSATKANVDVTEKKVEDFFKCLKKVPNKKSEVGDGEPYLVTRNGELPRRWDGPNGTVVLVNKPKGRAMFTFLH